MQAADTKQLAATSVFYFHKKERKRERERGGERGRERERLVHREGECVLYTWQEFGEIYENPKNCKSVYSMSPLWRFMVCSLGHNSKFMFTYITC